MAKTNLTESKNTKEKSDKEAQIPFKEDLVNEIKQDYESRVAERRGFEAQWQLNSNFVLGNQYCAVGLNGDVEFIDKDYYWQEREVFNHIAPIIETRLAKLNRVRPKMSVRPFSGDDDDIKTAKVSSKILSSACNRLELDRKIAAATHWSELTGTVFYKIYWDNNAGKNVGKFDNKKVFEGDVKIDVCPPYEIFPSSSFAQDLEECPSIIHAKAVSVDTVKQIYGIEVKPVDVDVMSVANISVMGGLGVASAVPGIKRDKKEGYCLVIERYTRPTFSKPDGELAVIAGNELLYYGVLPYINGDDGKRDLPFVKQESLVHAGCFFGMSMIERSIPIQRAYNAVKNRKHEFLNRIAVGVLAVEDGSVDTENLADEGLSPGKILVYRQGSTPPRLMDAGHVPSDFGAEEDRLLSEFISISGVSEIMRSSSVPSTLSSGVALSLLIEQDDTRLAVTAEHIRNSVRKIAKQILRLYKQFASSSRVARIVGEGGEPELLCWNASSISCDDVVFDSENELNSTPASKQTMMFDLLKLGLFHNENGKLTDNMRYKILDSLGYGGWEHAYDLVNIHMAKAEKENAEAGKNELNVLEIDDHNVHISIHTKFMLSGDFADIRGKNKKIEDKMLNHIREHNQFMSLKKEAEEIRNEQ